MNKKALIFSGSAILVTIFFVISYLSFNVLGITKNRLQRFELTLVSESSEKLYDGTPLTNSIWSIESGKLENSDTMEIVMSSTITNPGSINNDIGITIYDSTNKIVTSNYKIKLKPGTLTILPIELRIQTESLTKTYNGIALSSQIWSVQNGTLLPDHHFEAIMSSTITAPGTINNDVGITILDDRGNNVSYIYHI